MIVMGDFRNRTQGLDWSAVGQEGDPVPGRCQSLYEAYLKCATRSRTCGEVSSFLGKACGDHVRFHGESAETFDVELGHASDFAASLSDAFDSAAGVFTLWADALEEYQRTADDACSKAMSLRSEIEEYKKALDAVSGYLSEEKKHLESAKKRIRDLSAQGLMEGDAAYDKQVRARDDASAAVDRYASACRGNEGSIAILQDDLDAEIKKVRRCKEEYERTGAELAGKLGTCESQFQELGRKYGTLGDWMTGLSVGQAAGYGGLAVYGSTSARHSSRYVNFSKYGDDLVQGVDSIGYVTGDGYLPALFPDEAVAAGSASSAGKIIGSGLKGSVVGSALGGGIEYASTYYSRVDEYGEKAARQDAAWHAGIATGSGIAGGIAGTYAGAAVAGGITASAMATGAVVGSAVPVIGTAVGAVVGIVVGVAANALANGGYDACVGRGDGGTYWEHVMDNR